MPEQAYQGETVPLENTLTDYDGSPLTPDSQKTEWWNAMENGEKKYTDDAPTLKSAGVYLSKYTLPVDAKVGTWKVVWTVVKGNDTKIGIFTFEVLTP